MDSPATPTALRGFSLDEVEALHQELERLSAEIIEASEERAQAAEYGLVVLEEKQALQLQHDELSSLYESTKNELETSVNVSPECEPTPEYEPTLSPEYGAHP